MRVICTTITGKKATIVLSDDADASDRIDAFRESDDRWMVAVRMVSEGVGCASSIGGRLRDKHIHPAVLCPGRWTFCPCPQTR